MLVCILIRKMLIMQDLDNFQFQYFICIFYICVKLEIYARYLSCYFVPLRLVIINYCALNYWKLPNNINNQRKHKIQIKQIFAKSTKSKNNKKIKIIKPLILTNNSYIILSDHTFLKFINDLFQINYHD